MSTWVDAGPVAELNCQPGSPVHINGKWLAIFHLDDQYYATDNACPHASAPLCDGTLLEGKIICPLHLWEFDVKTGACDLGGQWDIQTYPTRVVEDRLQIELPE